MVLTFATSWKKHCLLFSLFTLYKKMRKKIEKTLNKYYLLVKKNFLVLNSKTTLSIQILNENEEI